MNGIKDRIFSAKLDKSKLARSRTAAIVRKENYYCVDEPCEGCGTYAVRHVRNGCTHCRNLCSKENNKKIREEKISEKRINENGVVFDKVRFIDDLSNMESGKLYIVRGRCAA